MEAAGAAASRGVGGGSQEADRGAWGARRGADAAGDGQTEEEGTLMILNKCVG